MAIFDAEALERLTGQPVRIADAGRVFAELPPLAYDPLTQERTAEVRDSVEEVIRNRDFRAIGEQDDQAVWETGWGEVASRIAAVPSVSIETLKPQYFHRGVPFRIFGSYAFPSTDYFEYYMGIAVRRQLMVRFLAGTTSIFELGCGTGINLLLASELFPDAKLSGSDWVSASSDLLNSLSRATGRGVSAYRYDMLSGTGAEELPIGPDADVLTVHALEQLGNSARAVLDHILKQNPRRVLHLEPIVEFYEGSDWFDNLAFRYHRARGYLEGLEPFIREMQAAGKIRVLGEQRVRLGNTYHEAYSYIAWEPVR